MTNQETINLTGIDLQLTQPDQAIHQLLETNNLPIADIESPEIELYEATLNNKRIGVGGYEVHGSTALLRSIAVHPELRGHGIGTTICLELEDEIACNMGDAIYLLTNDAVEFFEKIGYERINRETAPEPIQRTQEFAELCPTTAVCMKKTI